MAVSYATFSALYNFTPQQADEVELRVGDIILVKKPLEQDVLESWLEGKNQRTQQFGLIPGPYIKEIEFPETFVSNNHSFEKICKVFPSCCASCKDYMWGKNNHVYRCSKCLACFHLKCAKQNINQCSASKKTENDESPYELLSQPVREWKVNEVLSWMAATNLFIYANIFKKYNINGEKLLNFDEIRLENMGITNNFHKRMILVCIGELIGNSETRTIQTYPGMKTGQGSMKTHSFILQSFTKVTWCHECGHILFGLARQGLQCQKCALIVHRQCTNEETLRVCPQKIMMDVEDPILIPLLENSSIPDIVKKCVGVVESRGLLTKEIYRKQPDNSDSIYNLRKHLYEDAEDVDMKEEEWINPLYPSSVLFSYFDELPEPLLPSRVYNDLLAITATARSHILQLDRVLNDIPEVNLLVLNYLFEHLNRVAATSGNLMTGRDIADIFGLVLLRPNQENVMDMATNMDAHSHVVRLLLERSNKMSVINRSIEQETEQTEDDSPPVPPRPSKSIEYQEWYHGAITSNDVQRIMDGCRDGSFLVRDSKQHTGEYTLCVRKDNENKLIKIINDGGKFGFAINDTPFDSVPAVIENYRVESLGQYNSRLDTMLLYPVPRENVEDMQSQSGVKKATKILKVAGERFNEKSLRYEELSEELVRCDQDLSSLDEAIYAQKELLKFLDDQVKIHQNFQREASANDKESLMINFSFVSERLAEENRNLSILESDLLEKTKTRRQLESSINKIKPDLWELQHTKDKYMRFLEQADMNSEEVSLLAGNTDFTIYEMPMSEEDESVNLSEEYWLFGTLDRSTVHEYLDETDDGTFLIRDSNQNRGLKVVSIMFDKNIKHCVIDKGPEGYGFTEGFKTHKTLLSLVEYYHRVSLQMHNAHLATTLRLPVRCKKPEIPVHRK